MAGLVQVSPATAFDAPAPVPSFLSDETFDKLDEAWKITAGLGFLATNRNAVFVQVASPRLIFLAEPSDRAADVYLRLFRLIEALLATEPELMAALLETQNVRYCYADGRCVGAPE